MNCKDYNEFYYFRNVQFCFDELVFFNLDAKKGVSCVCCV